MELERGPEGREGQPGREGTKGREGIPGTTGPEGPEGPAGPRGRTISRPIKLAFVIVTLIFFATLAGFSWLVHDVNNNSERLTLLVLESETRAKQLENLVTENEARIADIQKTRIESCELTYAGIREVFRPFFPQPPRTPKQQADLDKFNSTIVRLQNGCKKQTSGAGK